MKDEISVDISAYSHSFSGRNKLGRFIWNIGYWFLFRPFNLNQLNGYRRLVLRLFGAKVGAGANIYATAKIWAPWNLKIGSFSTIGPQVDIYNQGKITIGSNTVISQKCYLCASTHDYELSNYPLILKPILIEDQVWIAAGAFIGPGVIVHEGSVVGAKSAVFKNVEDWTVVGGNPARNLKKRILNKYDIR